MFRFMSFIFFFLSAQVGLANLQVFPTRAVISEKERATQISLRNKGDKKVRYRISTVYYKMAVDGSLQEIKDEKLQERSAVPYIRYSPRIVELEPNQEQVVRVLLKPGSDMTDGDYRIHLLFEDTEEAAPEASTEKPKGPVMSLKAKLAIAIPVIVRHGNSVVDVKLEDPGIVKGADGKTAFTVTLLNKGNGFPYGDFKVYFKAKDKEEILISEVNGVSSYIPKRTISYSLSGQNMPTLNQGTLKIEMRNPNKEGSPVMAEVSKNIP